MNNKKKLTNLNNIGAINDEINKYYFEKHLKRESNRFDIENKKTKDIDNYSDLSLPIDDLLETNGISDIKGKSNKNTDNKNIDDPNAQRYTKFVSSYIHLNSSNRIMDGEYESVLNTITIVSASETEFKPPSPIAVVKQYPKTCYNGGTQLNCDATVSTVTTGGRTINMIMDGKTAPTPKPVCGCLVPVKPNHDCPFDGNDNDDTRLTKTFLTDKEQDRLIAQRIIKLGKIYNASSEMNKDYLGYESIRDQVLVQSNLDIPAIVPPTDCDPTIVRVSSKLCDNFSNTPLYIPKYTPQMIGGIRGETVVQQVKSVTNNEFNRYLFKLDRRYNNIKLIKMVSCIMPIHDYIINTYNNQIIFQIQHNNELLIGNNNTLWEYYIPIGNYDANSLATVIETDINQLIKSIYKNEPDVFSIKVDRLRNKFTITTIEDYVFTWRFVVDGDNERALYKMLGFEHSSQSTFVDQFTNLYPFNLKTNDYLLVKLEGYNTLYDCVTNDKYFNLIKQKYNNCSENSTSIMDRHLNIETVNESSGGFFEYADFKFYDQWGRPLNFMNRDFSIVLLVVEYFDQVNGFNSNTRRGVIDNTSVTKGLIQKL